MPQAKNPPSKPHRVGAGKGAHSEQNKPHVPQKVIGKKGKVTKTQSTKKPDKK